MYFSSFTTVVAFPSIFIIFQRNEFFFFLFS